MAAIEVFPTLIEEKDRRAERHGKEVKLHCDTASTERTLNAGDVGEEDGKDEGRDHGGEEPRVARPLAPERRLLKDGEATGASGEKVKPLHDDQAGGEGQQDQRTVLCASE